MVTWKTPTVLAGLLLAGGGGTLWWRRHQATLRADGQWAVVTVLHPRTAVVESSPFDQLNALGPELEVELRDAPGKRGTEVAARWRSGRRTGGTRDDLRTSLRELKQALETGEVLHATPRPEGRRPPTPGGIVIDLADRRAQGKGAL